MRCFAPLLLACTLTGSLLSASDWPQWRFDAARSAASDEELPDRLQPAWERQLGGREPVWDDPLNHDLMPYDRIFEPVAADGRIYVGFNDRDKVVAYDLATGKEVWTAFAGGPVRLPPACHKGNVYFACDDGHLHCVDAATGAPVWSFRGAPSARKALGNRRLISAWPARGGPVIRDGQVYFAASIWPFMGTFLHALDATSGKIVWVNDGTGADFIKQPHSAASFAGVAPQGALVATADRLLVPGGRSVPAAFDRATGALQYFHLNDGGKGNGGSFVIAGPKRFYVHTRERGVRDYELATGEQGKLTLNEPVIDGDLLYTAAQTKEGKPVVHVLTTEGKTRWEVAADATGDLIRAGRRLYAAGGGQLSAIELSADGAKARVVWTLPVPKDVQRLLAANDRLIAVTLDGRLLTFAEKPGPGVVAETALAKPAVPDNTTRAIAQHLLESVEDPGGYSLIYGQPGQELLDALLAASAMQFTVVTVDASQVGALRRAYDVRGLHGKRVSFHHGDPLAFEAPPFIAPLVIAAGPILKRLRSEPAQLQAAYASVRPYGGRLALLDDAADWTALAQAAGLENAEVNRVEGITFITRAGALAGAADWTHQYGNIANTVKSDDRRVRAPLGVLWFGGNSNLDVLPRHGHGPPEQVIGGRLYIEGMNTLSARDVYTGRVLWKHDFGDLGTFGIYYNETYADTPLSTEYNQKHIPGANGRGTNFVATEERVYVALRGECQVLDARDGKLRQTLHLRENRKDPAQWAFIGVYEDLLLGGDDFAHFSLRLGGAKSRKESTIEDYSASAGLAAFDRHTGKPLWRVKARHSFLHNAIVAGNGRIYCLDKLTKHAEDLLKRRGRDLPKDYRIVALDARTGAVVWEETRDVFGTWLGYSEKHDLLLQAGAKASDRLSSEVGEGMAAYAGATGKRRWADLKRAHTGPCILHNDLILTGANSYSSSGGAFSLLTGEAHLVLNPLTGKKEPWRLNRTYGCNTIIASEHLLTYRSGAAGFYDLESMSGTSSLGGFKSGCTSNLVVANGVLNAPDYTRTCSCGYQNQTSLALIPMADVEMWTYSQFGLDGEHGDRVLRAGINFGAPGNRRATDGTLWLEHPHAGDGNAPQIGVEGLAESATYFRRHSSQAGSGTSPPWIAASGLTGEGEIILTPSLRRPLLVKPVKKAADDGKGSPPPPEPPVQEPLRRVDFPALPHTVRLHFAEPGDLAPGARVFHVALQGRTVLENFDPAREASGGTLVREFRAIPIGAELRIRLTTAPGSQAPPVLCGIEFAAEPAGAE